MDNKLKHKHVINFYPDRSNQSCTFVEDIAGNITRFAIDLREKALYDALIALGWTPPKGKKK